MAEMLDILWLERILNAQYPLIIQRWVFPLVIGLVSLSLPLLINNIQRVDEKFKRYHVGLLLLSNKWVKSYLYLVFLTLFAIALYLLQLPSWVDWGYELNEYIDHSAEIFVLLTSSLLLLNVLIVIFVIIKHTTNTQAIYRHSKRKIKCYYCWIAFLHKYNLHTIERDGKIAKWRKFYQLIAIIETAIEEQDLEFIDEILVDWRKYIIYYRNKYAHIYSKERHNLIEYPCALTAELHEIARAGFEKQDVLTQQQVYFFVVNALFDIPSSNNFDIPKNGIGPYTLKTLWTILIDATNANKVEYIKLYWVAIFEYTKRMFHAPAITMDPALLHDTLPYNLTDKDKFEQALIAFTQFMWQAYLYDQKKYEILKYVLEYYNGYTDLDELNFFSLDRVMKIYSMKELTDNPYARIRQLNIIDNVIATYSYYTTQSTSEIEKQKRIVANYVAFLINYQYNKWKEIPICSRNIAHLSDENVNYLDAALKQQVAHPGLRINNVAFVLCMKEDGVDTFMDYLKARGNEAEHAFISDTDFRVRNKEKLFAEIKRGMTFDITHRQFVWIDNLNRVDADYRQVETNIDLNYDIAKEVMLYASSIDHNYVLPKDIAKQFLSKIEEAVMLSYYKAHAIRKVETRQVEELRQVLLNKDENERAILFAQNDDQRIHYQESLQGTYEAHRGYIDLVENDRPCSIKCVILPQGNQRLSALANQLWIIPRDLQPILHFVDIDNKDGWTSIHEYAKKSKATMDKSDVEYSRIPIYVSFSDIPDKEGVPMIQLNIKCKAKIFGLKRLHIKVLRLL